MKILKPFAGLWLTVALFLNLVGCNSAARPGAAPVSPPIVTQSEFDQLQVGMNYKQVETIIGAPGKWEHSVRTTGVTQDFWNWANSDGSQLKCQFWNGALKEKTMKPKS